jgi:hypothetical protein
MYVAKRRGKNLLVFYACEFEEAPPRREEAIAAPAPTPAYGSCDQVKC